MIAVNKMDLTIASPVLPDEISREQILYVSAAAGTHIHELKELLQNSSDRHQKTRKNRGEISSIPETLSCWSFPLTKLLRKGRLILPQQQTIRDILDHHGRVLCVQDTELRQTLDELSVKPRMVITDSQAFAQVDRQTPKRYPSYFLFNPVCKA